MPPYTQHENIVYSEVHGVALVLDVFVPTGAKNGIGIVDIASGAWYSDRGKINDHKKRRCTTSSEPRGTRSSPCGRVQ